MHIDKKMEILKKELDEYNVKEMARIHHYLDNDLDSDGNTILDKFPHRVVLEHRQNGEKVESIDWGFIDWLDENIKEDEFTREWVTRVYFKNEEDAVAFKLRWL